MATQKTIPLLMNNKTFLDWVRTAVGAAFIIGSLWTGFNSRLVSLEKSVDKKIDASRLEQKADKLDTQNLSNRISNVENSLKATVPRIEINQMTSTLNRIEVHLNDANKRLRGLENSVAVITATTQVPTE